MAITHTNIVNTNSAQDVATFVTSSFTPVADRLYFLFVINKSASGSGNTPTITTTTGLNFVEIGNQLIGAGIARLTLFRALKPSGLSTGTATVVLTGQTQSRIHCVLDEFAGTDITGTDGTGAVVQVVQNVNNSDVTSYTRTLAAFGSSNNGTYFGAGWYNTTVDITTAAPNTGFTEIADTNAYLNSTPNRLKRHVAWRADNSTECTSTLDGGSSARAGMIAVEIKAAGGIGYSLTLDGSTHVVSGADLTTTFVGPQFAMRWTR